MIEALGLCGGAEEGGGGREISFEVDDRVQFSEGE